MRTNEQFGLSRAAGMALLATTMLSAPGMAMAQDSAARPAVSDDSDIIVTAQKREENLQTVPISIQALGTQKLEQQNINNFTDYAKLLPSLAFQSTQPGQTNVYMRGVALASGGNSDFNHSGPLPTVGVYFDEQPVTTIGGTLDVHIYDVARVEALSGPQGTLYGASSEAGVLRIISNKPDASGFDAAFNIQANTIRHGGEGYTGEGFVNIPLSPSAALRLVGWAEHGAGYIDNVPGTRTFLNGLTIDNAAQVKKDYNDYDKIGGRAALKIDLDDNWTILPTVMGQDQKTHGVFGYDPKVGDLQVQHFLPENYHDRWVQAALTIQGRIGNFDLTYAGAYLDRKLDSMTDYTDYAVQYDAIYADAGGFAQYFTNADGDFIDPSQHIFGKDHFTKLSQEFRIATPSENRIRLVAGAFYQRQTHLIEQDYKITDLDPALSVNGHPGTIWLTKQNRIDRDYALFGEVAFDINDQLTLTGGLRGFKSRNTLIGFFGFGDGYSSGTGVSQCFKDGSGNYLGPILDGAPCTDLGDVVGNEVKPKLSRDTGVLHRLNLTYKPSDDQMFYATWSRGFRPGGINRRGGITPYKPDFLTNYELGMKLTMMDRRVRFNVALFQERWKAFQYSFLGLNSLTEIRNAGNARIRGLEADLNVRASPGLTFSAAATYIDAKTRTNYCTFLDPTFTCTQPGNSISAPKGTRLPVTPKLKFNATARYEFDAGPVKAHLQGTVVHQGSSSSDLRVFEASLTGRQRAWTSVDLAGGVAQSHWTADLFVSNLFDKLGDLYRYAECASTTTDGQVACGGNPYIVPIQPRTIGLRVGWKY